MHANELLGQTHNVFDCCVGSKVMSNFTFDESRHDWFARRLHQSNVFEGIRIHKTFVKDGLPYICLPHCDSKNSKDNNLSRVMWWSSLIVVDGTVTRIGLVGYWKASIDDYLTRRNDHKLYLNKCRHAIQTFPSERRSFLGNDLSSQQPVPFFSFLPISRSHCNLKIESYYQPFVFAVSSLLFRYPGTSLREVVSVVMAIARTFCSASFTCAAVRMLFAEDPATVDKGWWLVKRFAVMDQVHEEGQMKLTLRFGKYGRFGKPIVDDVTWSRNDWNEAITRITREVELVRRLPSVQQEDYNRLHRHLQHIPMVGTLSANHAIGILSIIGIVPLKLFPMVNGGADKFIADLKESLHDTTDLINDDDVSAATNIPKSKGKKNKKKKIKKKDRLLPNKEVVMENVRYMCEVELNRGPITNREGENQCCKIGRVLTNSDKRYWDITEDLCPTFHVDSKGEKIEFSNGVKLQGSIFEYKNGEWVTDLSFHILSNKKKSWMNDYN